MNLYFIAIIPPEEIRVEIQYLKEDIRERFGAEHALKLPAHITLVPPFKIKGERELQLLQALEIFAATHTSFHINLSGFGGFEPRVLYVEISEKEKIIALQNELSRNLTFIPILGDSEFHPHITLATRDLKETDFHEGLIFLSRRDYESRFEVSGLSLLKHNGKDWENFMDFNFKKS